MTGRQRLARAARRGLGAALGEGVHLGGIIGLIRLIGIWDPKGRIRLDEALEMGLLALVPVLTAWLAGTGMAMAGPRLSSKAYVPATTLLVFLIDVAWLSRGGPLTLHRLPHLLRTATFLWPTLIAGLAAFYRHDRRHTRTAQG